MTRTVRVAALTSPRHLELRTLERPQIGDDDGLLQVEACGICGSDIMQYEANANRAWRYPMVPGHEVVGRIEEIGPAAAARWGVNVGDRVAVEPPLPCGRCRGCRTGAKISSCEDDSLGYLRAYSQIPMDIAPGLWGGYAEMMYLHPMTTLHRVDETLPIRTAVLFNPLGNGIQWSVLTPNLRIGETILILGPGQRGLGSVVAAREAGASQVLITGLSRDAHKLEVARTLGADHTIIADKVDVVASVRDATGGLGVDVVVDTTPGAHQPILDAIGAVRPGGRIVLAGLKHDRPIEGLNTDLILTKEIVVMGVRTGTPASFATALDILSSHRYPMELMATHAFGLDQAERAIQTLVGTPDDPAIAVCLTPN